MKANPFYTWLPALLTIVVTVLGFLVFAPEEPGKLFYVNLVYLIVLEGLFFGWFHMGKLKGDADQTPYFKVFVGIHTMYYLLVSIVWMVIYTAFLSEKVDLKIYLLVIAIISLIWIVLASIIGRQDTHYHAQQTQLEDSTMDIRAFRDELKVLAQEHATPATERAWKQLIMEADSIPPKQFAARYAQLRKKAEQLINS
jgi:ABC-type transport system involved in cytochrome bd biosynthesis fused ATPase/permease subunit